ncbi:hypothetical protein U9M48_029730 [Paspalum notatum var. saurae]|uniref:Reverse transcriptase domain-containing protein n=1 Tax=Paspalum notatum var. saurae TaxID=547442 RepID=A0AAQ3TZH1_PASNO
MCDNHLLVWNARGLNSRAHRNVVRNIALQHRASVVCLQETKIEDFSVSLNNDLLGCDFDFIPLPAVGAAGGAVSAWRRDLWDVSSPHVRRFTVTFKLRPLCGQGEDWWLTNVYGPPNRAEKDAFLLELRDVRAGCPGPWLLVGDFNLIYQAADKNNGRLHRSLMARFRAVLDDLLLSELLLSGRLFTWSNGRDSPTLERLDRAFASVEWLEQFPSHQLRCLSSDSSDHAPLLLVLDTEPWGRPRFRFDNYWTKIVGFSDVVAAAWGPPNPDVDACRALDQKLRHLAKALRSWHATQVGDVPLQLAVARVVIAEFDIAQESRQLSLGELQLYRELKAYVPGLASLERTMARQRARTRYLRENDACTKFFHLQACHRRRKNYLFAINHAGQTFSDEQAKAGIVHSYYSDLLGTPFPRQQRIDLTRLDLPTLVLGELVVPFTMEEVTRIVHETPSDRAPGPDGFTGAFYKAAWGVVGLDVFRVFQALWEMDFRSFHSLNDALMVLLQKTDAPAGLKDYRPISLMHSVGKMFAKGLALRLAPRMHHIVKINQSAFVRGRRIHENYHTVQLTCRWLYARRVPAVLLKIDLAKAFDSVAWPFLLEVLERISFPQRWRDWVSAILSSASTKVLVNGRAGLRICHARGLRQGDPLSPLLFVIVMEVLNALFAEADRSGMLAPLPGDVIKYRASIYADDLVIFLTPTATDFSCVRRILELFAGASGLATNLDKCVMTPIRCSEVDIDVALGAFPCRLQHFPVLYLGVPLALTRLDRATEQRLVDKVAARIPSWKGGLLTKAGRKTLVQTTLSAIPVHTSICCALSSWAIEEIDKRRRAFLWAGSDTVVAGKCMLAWPFVCAPKELGGLGLPDLRSMGFALRLRWEWQRRSQPDVPWARLPCRKERVVDCLFRASVSVVLGDGAHALFWTDAWLPEGAICNFAPRLFRAVGCRRRGRTVREALQEDQWVRDIVGAPTAAVIDEFLCLRELLHDVQLRADVPDRFVWRWTADGSYSSSSAYQLFFAGRTPLAGAPKIWKASAPPKVKFFCWLVLHGRPWTAERRHRHGLQACAACALCSQEDESIDHLLTSCVFTRQVWHQLLSRVGLAHLCPTTESRHNSQGTLTRKADKVAEVTATYEKLLGHYDTRHLSLNLNELEVTSHNLESLEEPFSEQEIEQAVKLIPKEKAPGPDVVQPQYQGFHWLNRSHVVLIPKKPQPESVSDYRPISLTHSFIKLFSKVLASRLASIITTLVDVNQSAFIKKRCIQDNFKLVQNTVQWLHKRKVEALLVRIDISKAFDTVSWPYLIEVLSAFGFGQKWLFWISTLMLNSRSAFFVNGSLTRDIEHRRGVRQGDPLSPLLFVLAMEPLNRLIKRAEISGVLSSLPSSLTRFRLSLYADDIVMFLRPTLEDVTNLHVLFGIFGQASGLAMNPNKSEFFPIKVDEGKLLELQAIAGVKLSAFPTRYLGLPLHSKRIPNDQVQVLVDKISGRLAGWKKCHLTKQGRVVLVNSVLTGMTTYWLLVDQLPTWAIKQIDKCRRNFIWKGHESWNKASFLVAWNRMCRSKMLGGLGIKNLAFFGRALRLKWLWHLWGEAEKPWKKLNFGSTKDRALFFASTIITIGNGQDTPFWEARWLNGVSPKQFAPELYIKSSRKLYSVNYMLTDNKWLKCIGRIDTMQELDQAITLCCAVKGMTFTPDRDQITWIWTSNGDFTVASAYEIQFIGAIGVQWSKFLWKATAQPKCKFFAWSAILNRINTAELLAVKGLPHQDVCYLCNLEFETTYHLLSACPFTA